MEIKEKHLIFKNPKEYFLFKENIKRKILSEVELSDVIANALNINIGSGVFVELLPIYKGGKLIMKLFDFNIDDFTIINKKIFYNERLVRQIDYPRENNYLDVIKRYLKQITNIFPNRDVYIFFYRNSLYYYQNSESEVDANVISLLIKKLIKYYKLEAYETKEIITLM